MARIETEAKAIEDLVPVGGGCPDQDRLMVHLLRMRVLLISASPLDDPAQLWQMSKRISDVEPLLGGMRKSPTKAVIKGRGEVDPDDPEELAYAEQVKKAREAAG